MKIETIVLLFFITFLLIPVGAGSIEYNGSDDWAGTSGTMLEHGDGNLRSPPSVTSGLTLYWNPTTDVGSGSTLTDIWDNNDGTISGATWNVLGGGLDFDGVNDQVIISNDASLNLTTNFTLEMWIEPDDLSTEWGVLLLKGASDANVRAYSIYLNYDQVYISWYNGNWRNFVSTSGILQNDTMYHIVYVRTTTHETIYIDGIKNVEDVIAYSMINDSYDMRFGWKGQIESVEIFNGIIGQTKIHNQPLSNDQVNESRDNFHTTAAYRKIDTSQDSGAWKVWKYVNISGTDAGSNTTIELQVKKNDTAIWETAIADVTMNTNLTIPAGKLYQNASFRWYANTSYQPETDVIESVTFISGTLSVAPIITLNSFSPSPLNTNYTGVTTISYMVNSSEPLNYSSLAFLHGVNYTITGDMHNYLSVPYNDISDGYYKAPNRNVTPYLSWEFNDTITEGNVWQWGGGDNDSSWITKTSINATHTWINVTRMVPQSLSNAYFIHDEAVYNAPMTGFEINRQQGLILKGWDLDQIRNRNNDYFVSLFFDTSWESTLPAYPIEIGYCNESYNPAVDDIDTCPNCTKFLEWNGTRWINHSWNPSTNASYASPLVINAQYFTDPSPDDIAYVWLRSYAHSSKSYVLNATDYDPGLTNITFAETQSMWTYNEQNGVTSPAAYTPSYFAMYTRDDEDFLHHIYIANDQGVWGHSEIFNETIGISSVPVSPVSFEYFNVTCDESYHDREMDATYDQGTVGVGIYCPADPDGTIVSHNLTLHYYPNMTLVAVINNTFTTTGAEDVEVEFTTAPYYSSDTLYTLRCVSKDGDDNVATKWLISYFALDADGNQGWVKDDKLLFWGMNNIPTLYAEVSNNSLISYNAGTNNYTMHVPFFKSKDNDTFYFNETVHLESLNNEDVAHFRFTGRTVFDNATILGWNTTTDTAAPITDEYRSYVYSLTIACGNITNSNFSYLGSDFYRQEGLNFVDNSHEYLIHNSVFSHNAEGPIFEECSNFTISNCTISDNVNVGIGVYFSDNFIIENNTISSNGGRSVTLYEANDNIISYNDITNSGIHGIHYWSNSINNTCTGNDISGSALYDYYLSSSSTGNYIIDPASTTDRIRVTSTSSVNIENTDNTAFTEDSLETSYAYLTNFSMYVAGTSQTFDITQRDMSIWPTTDKVKISNLVWNSRVTFDSDSDIAINPTWFNITSIAWADSEVHVYRDAILYDNESAESNGSIFYYYDETFLGAPHFEFRITVIPTPLLFNVFLLLLIITVGFTGYSILINDTTNFTHIITGFLSGILWFILGYQAYIGIGFEHTITDSIYSIGVLLWTEELIEVTTYQYSWMGQLFIVIGVIMMLYTIVQTYNANRDIIKQLEGEKDDQ